MSCTGDCGETPITLATLDELARRLGESDAAIVFWAKRRIEDYVADLATGDPDPSPCRMGGQGRGRVCGGKGSCAMPLSKTDAEEIRKAYRRLTLLMREAAEAQQAADQARNVSQMAESAVRSANRAMAHAMKGAGLAYLSIDGHLVWGRDEDVTITEFGELDARL